MLLGVCLSNLQTHRFLFSKHCGPVMLVLKKKEVNKLIFMLRGLVKKSDIYEWELENIKNSTSMWTDLLHHA